jgi:hypothetical protein
MFKLISLKNINLRLGFLTAVPHLLLYIEVSDFPFLENPDHTQYQYSVVSRRDARALSVSGWGCPQSVKNGLF